MNNCKFHQSYSYITNIGSKVVMNLSVVGNRLIGVNKTTHPKFPTITSTFDGLEPSGMREIEIGLKKDERKNRIKDLTFGRIICVSETNDNCVEVQMN